MGVITDLDEGNIFTSIEELSEEEHQDCGQGALQSTILEGIQEKLAWPGHKGSRLRDALLHAQE